MATRVITQHVEVLGKLRHRHVPHMQVGADGVGQQQDRLVGRAVKAIGETYAVAGGDERKGVVRSHDGLQNVFEVESS